MILVRLFQRRTPIMQKINYNYILLTKKKSKGQPGTSSLLHIHSGVI